MSISDDYRITPQIQQLFQRIFARNPTLMRISDAGIWNGYFNFICNLPDESQALDVQHPDVKLVGEIRQKIWSACVNDAAYMKMRCSYSGTIYIERRGFIIEILTESRSY